METIGMRRDIDNLGRLCIPKEIRTLLKLENEVELIVTTEGLLIKNPNYILVKKAMQMPVQIEF